MGRGGSESRSSESWERELSSLPVVSLPSICHLRTRADLAATFSSLDGREIHHTLRNSSSFQALPQFPSHSHTPQTPLQPLFWTLTPPVCCEQPAEAAASHPFVLLTGAEPCSKFHFSDKISINHHTAQNLVTFKATKWTFLV